MVNRPSNPAYAHNPGFEFQKLGVGKIQDIEDLIVKYDSSVFKEQNNFKESVLHMMYVYRKDKF